MSSSKKFAGITKDAWSYVTNNLEQLKTYAASNKKTAAGILALITVHVHQLFSGEGFVHGLGEDLKTVAIQIAGYFVAKKLHV